MKLTKAANYTSNRYCKNYTKIFGNMTHRDKVKLARSLITQKEIQDRVSIWDSNGWRDRKIARYYKQVKQVEKKKVLEEFSTVSPLDISFDKK